MFNRVLILSFSFGSGHLRAAQALQKAFYRLGAAHEVHVVDALQYSSKFVRGLFLGGFHYALQKVPTLYGWLYDRFNVPKMGPEHRNPFEQFNAGAILKLLEEHRPDLVICTHALPAGMVSWLRGAGRIAVPHAVVVTDFDIHALWACRNCDRYFVASEDGRQRLKAFGVPTAKVAVTGIPVDPAFAEQQPRAEARRQLGLDPDRTTILVTSGGWALGSIDEIVRSLQDLHHRAQIVVICALNQTLKTTVERIACTRQADAGVRIIPIGWTMRMHIYMSAADLVIGKAGGLTTSETLAKGLPLLIVHPIRGQEEHNADYLLEQQVAVRCNYLLTLAHKVDALLDNPQRLADLRTNARRLGRPDAALDIVRALRGQEVEAPEAEQVLQGTLYV